MRISGRSQFTEGDMHTKKQSGFTLVELAVVVFLVGLMASVGLAALNAQMTSASVSVTKKKQEIIKDALIAYLGANKRLPCPAKPDASGIINGTENLRNSASPYDCTGNFGIVPYATLGLSKSTALDGYENFFSYAVSQQWTLTYGTAVAPPATTPTAGSAFHVGISGTLTVSDRSPTSPYTATPISSNAAAFIISHGKNGLGAFTTKGTQSVAPANGTDEKANAPDPATWLAPAAFYKRGYTDVDVPTYGAFDDVALVLNPTDLTIPLIKDGALKSAEARWAEQITNINNALIGDMFNDSRCAPKSDLASFTQLLTDNGIPLADPWGGVLGYSRNFCRLHDDGRYKTSNCSSDCGGGGCITPISSFHAFDVTTTSAAIIKPQTLSTITAAYQNLLNGCPGP